MRLLFDTQLILSHQVNRPIGIKWYLQLPLNSQASDQTLVSGLRTQIWNHLYQSLSVAEILQSQIDLCQSSWFEYAQVIQGEEIFDIQLLW